MKPGFNAKFCEFSYGDREVAILQEKGENSEANTQAVEGILAKKLNAKPPMLLGGVSQISWGNLNKTLYVATLKGYMQILDLLTRDQATSKRVHKDQIISFCFTPDRLFLFTCSRDETYCMIDPETLETITAYNFHSNISRAIAVSPLYLPNSKPTQRYHIVVGGGQDEKEVTTSRKKGGFEIKIVNYITSEELAEVKGHFGPVHTLTFSPNGKSFASGSEDGYVRLHFFQQEYFTNKFV